MIDTDRVRALMSEQGLSQAALAKRVGVSPPAIHQLLTGRTRRTSLVPALSIALNASVEYITGRSDTRHTQVASAIVDEKASEKGVAVSYGYDRTLFKELSSDTSLNRAMYNSIFDPYWLARQVARVSPELFAEHGPDFKPAIRGIFMGSTAMSPTIGKGDQLLISGDSRTIHDENEVWSLDYGGVSLIRRIMLLPNERGYLVSADNPAAPTFEASLDEVQLTGRVFWMGRMV